MLSASAAEQIFYLLVMAIPVATISWVVTHEELFREPREWCQKKSEICSSLGTRKFFYLFTCEFCFSFYVSTAVAFSTGFRLLYLGWTGYWVSILSLVWVANIYMSLFGRLRLDIKRERVELAEQERGGNTTQR